MRSGLDSNPPCSQAPADFAVGQDHFPIVVPAQDCGGVSGVSYRPASIGETASVGASRIPHVGRIPHIGRIPHVGRIPRVVRIQWRTARQQERQSDT
jgi:hypothetical protein